MRALPPQSNPVPQDDEAQGVTTLRPYLFSIAYRMLGSASDAEDVVQEAFLRYFSDDRESVKSPKAFLATIVTRLCLDHLKSARVTRSEYVGPWLPEPVLTEDLAPGPDEQAERRDDVSLAFLVLLERLTPEERAAFVLREAFGFSYDDIAAMLDKSNAACRKLLQRARQHLESERRQFRVAFEDQRRLTERFLAAARDGNLAVLTDALTEDVTVWADGGPDVLASRRPLHGRETVVPYSIGIMQKVVPDALVTFEDVNGELAILFWIDGKLRGVTTVEMRDGRIAALRSVMNPEKLAHISGRVSPPAA